ncbi:MAG: hypothetical protein DRQ45_03485 [Gammaproteobacteria bacterium]|nr:MAG: hypothetical protein DRQ45_03485 [Gammaproteobacteria bacterium]
MIRTKNEAQRDMLIGLHNAIVDDRFFQGESNAHHETVEILAAVIAAQADSIRNDLEKKHSD